VVIMKRLLIELVWCQLRSLGAFADGERTTSVAKEAARLLPVYEPWLRECIRIFAREGFVERDGDRLDVALPPDARIDDLWRRWDAERQRWLANRDLRAQAVLLDATLRALPEILTGRRAATEVVFPNSSLALVEDIYKDNPMARLFNDVLAAHVVDYVERRAGAAPGDGAERPSIASSDVRILEIGAGTGATSAVVLDALRRRRLTPKEYTYTDLSRAFLNHAEKSYGPTNPFLTYRILNIELPPSEQGIDLAGYDIVIAANVLHATRNIRKTLRNTKALLKKNGLLLMNELTTNSLFNHLTFGLLEGWWLCDDPELRIPGSPGLSGDAWRHALESERYGAIAFPCREAEDLGQQIIVAVSDGVVRVPNAEPRAPLEEPEERAATNGVAAPPGSRGSGGSSGALPSSAPARVGRVIVEQLAESLRIPSHRIRADEPFSTYGLDSILAVQLTRSINEALGVDLDITVMFEHNTVRDLAAHIAEAFAGAVAEDAAPAEPAPSAPAPTTPAPTTDPARPLAIHEGSPAARAGAEPAPSRPGFAIVGMCGRFPRADDADAFWEIIEKGKRCITPPPFERSDWRPYAERAGDDPARWWGGFIDGIHEFDPLFFSISMTEARQMTPEQRLMLMCAWNTLEDAGYAPKALATRETGVFIAVGPSEYRPEAGGAAPFEPALAGTPSSSLVPNRISYALNLQGPSEACEATCASSLVALHRALRALEDGECSQAIVGGVNLIMSPAGFAGMQSVGMLSPSGRVRPFQSDADGTVRSEGVAAVLVKPLERAIDDGDFVYAVVRGTGVAHGGRGVSLTAPNVRGMKAAIRKAYDAAGVDPRSVSYVEAHGMSSTLADGAEITALRSALDGAVPSGVADSPMYVSCLKPCIGHAEVASGMAALMKTVLAIRHRTIPAIAGFGRTRGESSLADGRLRIAEENMAWPAPTDERGRATPRRASINSFGIGGVNAHAVIEEHQPPSSDAPAEGSAPQIVVLSAKDDERLRLRARRLADWLERAREADLGDVAYTLQVGREAMECRLAIVARSTRDLARALGEFLAEGGGASRRIHYATGAQRNAEIVDLCSTPAGESLVLAMIEEEKLDVVASYWVKGAPIDWSALHRGAVRRRVPLPGYPFQSIDCSSAPAAAAALEPAPRAPASSHDDVAAGAAEAVAGLVSSVLGLRKDEIDRARPLDGYGLNSLLLVTIRHRLQSLFPAAPPGWLQPHDTLDAAVLRLSASGGAALRGAAASSVHHPELVHLNAVTHGRPVFWIHGALGSVEAFQRIADRSQRPFLAIQARGFMTKHAPIEGIAAMAAYYVDVMRSVQPEGPYDIGGFCLGGILAYEMTRQLQARGESVRSLAMVDSPDNTAFRGASAGEDVSSKNAALQVTNTLLWPAEEKDLAKVAERLIHQDEIDGSLDDARFVDRLATLAVERGLSMRRELIVELIERNLRVQVAYRLGAYVIQPLPAPDAVEAVYFRNARGLFYGDLGPYFTIAGEQFSLDHVAYWQDWQREMASLRVVDVDAASHMTILYEEGALRVIGDACARLYAAEPAQSERNDGQAARPVIVPPSDSTRDVHA